MLLPRRGWVILTLVAVVGAEDPPKLEIKSGVVLKKEWQGQKEGSVGTVGEGDKVVFSGTPFPIDNELDVDSLPDLRVGGGFRLKKTLVSEQGEVLSESGDIAKILEVGPKVESGTHPEGFPIAIVGAYNKQSKKFAVWREDGELLPFMDAPKFFQKARDELAQVAPKTQVKEPTTQSEYDTAAMFGKVPESQSWISMPILVGIGAVAMFYMVGKVWTSQGLSIDEVATCGRQPTGDLSPGIRAFQVVCYGISYIWTAMDLVLGPLAAKAYDSFENAKNATSDDDPQHRPAAGATYVDISRLDEDDDAAPVNQQEPQQPPAARRSASKPLKVEPPKKSKLKKLGSRSQSQPAPAPVSRPNQASSGWGGDDEWNEEPSNPLQPQQQEAQPAGSSGWGAEDWESD